MRVSAKAAASLCVFFGRSERSHCTDAAGVDDGPASTAHGPKSMPAGAGQSIRADPHCWCAGYGDRTLQQGESWNRTTHDVRWCKTTGGPFFVRAAALIFGFARVSD